MRRYFWEPIPSGKDTRGIVGKNQDRQTEKVESWNYFKSLKLKNFFKFFSSLQLNHRGSSDLGQNLHPSLEILKNNYKIFGLNSLN
jgi:hypothetical protein